MWRFNILFFILVLGSVFPESYAGKFTRDNITEFDIDTAICQAVRRISGADILEDTSARQAAFHAFQPFTKEPGHRQHLAVLLAWATEVSMVKLLARILSLVDSIPSFLQLTATFLDDELKAEQTRVKQEREEKEKERRELARKRAEEKAQHKRKVYIPTATRLQAWLGEDPHASPFREAVNTLMPYAKNLSSTGRLSALLNVCDYEEDEKEAAFLFLGNLLDAFPAGPQQVKAFNHLDSELLSALLGIVEDPSAIPTAFQVRETFEDQRLYIFQLLTPKVLTPFPTAQQLVAFINAMFTINGSQNFDKVAACLGPWLMKAWQTKAQASMILSTLTKSPHKPTDLKPFYGQIAVFEEDADTFNTVLRAMGSVASFERLYAAMELLPIEIMTGDQLSLYIRYFDLYFQNPDAVVLALDAAKAFSDRRPDWNVIRDIFFLADAIKDPEERVKVMCSFIPGVIMKTPSTRSTDWVNHPFRLFCSDRPEVLRMATHFITDDVIRICNLTELEDVIDTLAVFKTYELYEEHLGASKEEVLTGCSDGLQIVVKVDTAALAAH